MKTAEAVKIIRDLDRRGRAVFTMEDLRNILPEHSERTFESSLRRLTARGVLQRAARGVYINPRTRNRPDMRERIALALRPGEASYLSLETVLGRYSLISQQIWSITVMTTGRRGRFRTPFGAIHFTHTARSRSEIMAGTVDWGFPLRRAKPHMALEDLRRTRCNPDLVDVDVGELELIEREKRTLPSVGMTVRTRAAEP